MNYIMIAKQWEMYASPIDHTHFLFPSLQLMEDCNQLQCELTALQDERDSTFQENLRLQNTLKVRNEGRWCLGQILVMEPASIMKHGNAKF